MKRNCINIGIAVIVSIVVMHISGAVYAYAPAIKGKVTVKQTNAPVNGLWIEWKAEESGCLDKDPNKFGTCRSNHLGNHLRYADTGTDGTYHFDRWDGQGMWERETKPLDIAVSPVGKTEYGTFIDLDYDPKTGNGGKEARKVSSPLFDLFNCHNESHTLSIRLPEKYKNAKVTGRWRQANQREWTTVTGNNIVLITGAEFNNNSDYEVEFVIDMPKQNTIRDLATPLEKEQISSLNSKAPVCVKTQLCSDKEAPCAKPAVAEQGIHRVLLTGIGELHRKLTVSNPDQPIWLVECIQKGTADKPQYTCTTGNAQLDAKVFGKNNLAELQGEYGYAARMYKADGRSTTTSEITEDNRQDAYEWETTLTKNTERVSSVFMAMYSPGETEVLKSQDQPSQKQATLAFSDACKLVVDPYGRVFDSYTLEPLANASVELTKKRSNNEFTKVQEGEVIGELSNPYITKQDGLFSFIVPPGTYKLNAKKEGYTFTREHINPLAVEMYSNVYKGEEVVQEGEPVHRDIPLEPQDKKKAEAYSAANPIEFINVFPSLNKEQNIYVIEGRVSHPRAKVSVFGQLPNKRKPGEMIRTRELASKEADSFGRFRLEVNLNLLRSGEIIGDLEAVKKRIPVTRTQSFMGPLDAVVAFVGNVIAVEAQERPSDKAVMKLPPVLNYISGYAMNESGTVLPNAQVHIMLTTSNNPVYTTTADASGWFEITTEYIPSVPYEIVFENNGQTVTMATDEFIARNSTQEGYDRVHYYAFKVNAANRDVLGAYEKRYAKEYTDPTPASIQTNTGSSDFPSIAYEGGPSGLIIVAAVIMITFIITATGLLSLYITEHGRKVRR